VPSLEEWEKQWKEDAQSLRQPETAAIDSQAQSPEQAPPSSDFGAQL
jgi:hypothetical protein